jgi:hypothetical protein
MRFAVVATMTLMLVGILVGCSNDDKPAVCSSVADLETSVNDVKSIDFTAGALADLESGLTTIRADLATVKTDAKSEFADEITAVDSAFTTFTTSVDAAKADPTAATLGAVATAVAPFTTAVETLISDVKSTC